MGHVTREMLERYHDGELSRRAAARVERHVAACEQCSGDLARLDRIGGLMRLMDAEESDGVSFAGFSDRVTAGIRRERRPALSERLSVWLGEFFEHRKAIWIPATVAISAALAVALIVPLAAPIPTSSTARTQGGIWAAQAGGPGGAPSGSEASVVSFGNGSGMVFAVPDGTGQTTAVVWFDEGSR